MNTPLVSVVIAAFQSDPFNILEAIDSALAQTKSEIEILIRDDSPTDQLRDVVSCRRDQRINYRHNTPPLGVAENHWQAFKQARGEFIAILNHDDLLEPEFIATLVAQLQSQPTSVLAFCDHWVIDSGGCILYDESDLASMRYGRLNLRPGMHQPFGDLLVAQTIPMAMGSVFRRAALPAELPNQAGPAYDIWLTYLLASTGGGACYVPKRLSSWRSHSANLTSGAGLPWLHGSACCWQAVARDKKLLTQRNAAERKAAGGFVACALRSWRDGKRIACLQYAARSLRMRLSLRGLALLLLLPCIPASLVLRLAGRFKNH